MNLLKMVPFALFVVLFSVPASCVPNTLPQSQIDYMNALYDVYGFSFVQTYPTNYGERFAVLAFDEAGRSTPLEPCANWHSFTVGDSPVNVVAQKWKYGIEHKRHAEIVIIEDYFSPMLQRFNDANGRNPHTVSLFINKFNCQSQCKTSIVSLAQSYPSIDFFIGYRHMRLANYEAAADALSGTSNLYFGDISSRQIYRAPYSGDAYACNLTVETGPGVLYAVRDDFKMGTAPNSTDDDWEARANLIGYGGWSHASNLFMHPSSYMFAVFWGSLYKDLPPPDASHPWLDNSVMLAEYDWSRYNFIFTDFIGYVYAADYTGLYKAFPPRGIRDNWFDRATTIGTTGWESLTFLFMHPTDGMMYAVQEGAFYRARPPQEAISADQWIDQATQIGTVGWDDFKFLFFHPSGFLYAVGYDGTLRAGSPPQYPTDDWYSRSTVLGSYGWEQYQFLFFDPYMMNGDGYGPVYEYY